MGKEVCPGALRPRHPLRTPFTCRIPSADELQITGSGEARVIGLVPHQIITESLRYPVERRRRSPM